MSKYLPSEQFDLNKEKDEPADEILTTELSDEELDIIYKKYKIITGEIKETQEELADRIEKLAMNFKRGKAFHNGRRITKKAELRNVILNMNKGTEKKEKFRG